MQAMGNHEKQRSSSDSTAAGPREGLNEEEVPLLPSDHPLLERVQAALFQQLSAQHRALSLKFEEKKEEERRLAQLHEELGVKLYHAQNEVQKQQETLQKLGIKEQETKAKRLHAEELLEAGTKELREKQQELDKHISALHKSRQEANELKYTLQQAEAYNERLESDIKLKRRETYKEDATLQKRETEKMEQDFLIDHLKEQLIDLTEQKELLETQYTSQGAETEAAAVALREAQREIEAVNAEKQRLLHQWKSSVNGMQRRNEALQAIKQMVSKQEEKELELETESRSLQAKLREVQEANETLTTHQKVKSGEIVVLEQQVENVEKDLELAEKQNTFWQEATQAFLEEGNKAELAASQIRDQIKVIEKDIQKASRENNDLSERILDLLSDQSTLHRAASSTSKRARELQEVYNKKEEEYEQVQNDAARTKVEVLEEKARHAALKEELGRLQKLLSEKEKAIDEYEADIKKGHIAIDKKQQLVERLNKEYDERRSKMDDEGTGPLEARIKSLRNSLSATTKEGTDMQNAWMKKQTELIAIQNTTASLEEEVSAKKDEQLMLQQRKIRLSSQIAQHSRELNETHNSMKEMRTAMCRTSQLIRKQVEREKQCSDEMKSLKQDFNQRRAEHEQLEAKLSQAAQSVYKEKEKIENDLAEAAKQIMLWERKIVLEKEMHEAVDPAIGQAELTAMKKEIHRMQLRLEQLKNYQEQTVTEMQKTIQKREFIQLKHEPRPSLAQEAQEKVALERQTCVLQQKLKEAKSTSSKLDEELKELTDEATAVHNRLIQLFDNISTCQADLCEAQKATLKLKVRRSFNLACILQYQKLIKRLNSANQDDAEAPLKASTVAAIRRVRGEAKNLAEIFSRIKQDFPDLDGIFEAYTTWALSVSKAVIPPSPASDGVFGETADE